MDTRTTRNKRANTDFHELRFVYLGTDYTDEHGLNSSLSRESLQRVRLVVYSQLSRYVPHI